jgi:hypothetical protein
MHCGACAVVEHDFRTRDDDALTSAHHLSGRQNQKTSIPTCQMEALNALPI